MNTSPLARLSAHAASVEEDKADHRRAWAKGFTRRRFIQGAGMVGAAALGSQLVTTQAAFAAPGEAGDVNGNSLVVVFLRGGCDWLRVLVPASSALGFDYLTRVRPGLLPAAETMLPLSGGWAANANLAPLMPFWNSGELAFVPAVATDPARSHTLSQRYLETGGASTLSRGWLDRLLEVLGPGTTFRAVTSGFTTPDSLLGAEQKIAMDSLSAFSMPGWNPDDGAVCVESLYRGLDLDLTRKSSEAIAALGEAARIRDTAGGPQNGAVYPDMTFGKGLRDIATMLRGEVGLQVATIDVGGWDTHTDEVTDLDRNLLAVSQCLAAFMTDLGPERRSRTTVVVMSEFGRRVAQNASGGTDHGLGSLMWVLGGGLKQSQVAGAWTPLADGVLDQGDVPGWNSPFSVLGEVAGTRMGATTSGLFTAGTPAPLGLFG